ncbi:DUF2291 domain-containing protein [Botryobacter ruber]|uniref:DUF2291 domain-containing protein n=1 Tax=Botryobacter ruber TaxID=2171629 RepID=UPI000E0B4B45|nr:DUF2291 domain-containing protein [Botryobacter ruber]
MKKRLKYIIAAVVVVLLAYNSVYFEKLSEVKAEAATGKFDAASYAATFWDTKLMPGLNQAVEVNDLMAQLQSDKEAAFKAHSNALGIGNIRYFLIKGEGELSSINENDVTILAMADGEQKPVKIATEFVYGNAVRDALGLVDLNDFSNTMDLNNVSEELNRKIRTEVVPPFRAAAKKGDKVTFIGAIELNKEHLRLDEIEVIPVALEVVKE